MAGKKFIAFGEVLLRLSPDGFLRFAQAERFNVNYTGAEANMAVALAHMGMPTEVVTRLPDNEIGRCALRMFRKFGAGTGHIAFGGERLGIYYLERGASQRASQVIYDRRHSAFSEVRYEDFDWDAIFADAGWFHFTGITAALGPELPDICRRACETAKRHGVTVSCDLNYRKNLWTTEQAQAAMKPLMRHVDVLIGNEEDSEKVLGIGAAGTDVTAGVLNLDGYRDLAQRLTELYGFKKVAFTLRESLSASVNNWSGLLYEDGRLYTSRKYTMQIVDRVGGGDSFASGLIYGILNGFDPQKALEFAVGASCLKHSIELDFNLSTVKEVLNLIGGDGSGRVVR